MRERKHFIFYKDCSFSSVKAVSVSLQSKQLVFPKLLFRYKMCVCEREGGGGGGGGGGGAHTFVVDKLARITLSESANWHSANCQGEKVGKLQRPILAHSRWVQFSCL